MFDWFTSLFDTSGFVPRRECGAWTPEWIAVHTLSDILIWLAYLSIPLVLLATLRRVPVRPFRALIALFAAFILACGFTHLIEAIIFDRPVYKLSGVVKAVTAAVSWATVFALVPTVPRLTAALDRLHPAPLPAPDPDADKPRALVYSLAILVALLSVLIRYTLDPILGELYAFSTCLLAVIFVAWYGGFGPGLVALLVGGALAVYLFVPPRMSPLVVGLPQQMGVGIYLFTGLGVVILGELQRTTRLRLHGKMLQLWGITDALTAEKRKADETLGRLDAFLRHAPGGIAILDADLNFVWVNETFAAANGEPIERHIGRPLRDVLPDITDDLADEYRQVIATGVALVNRTVYGRTLIWQMNAFRVPLGDGNNGLGVIGVDVTELRMGESRLRESEERFRTLTEAMPQIVWMTRPDGYHEYYNARWYEYTGMTPEQSIGWGWSAPLHPDDVERSKARWEQSTRTGEQYEIEYRFRRHDGEYQWFLGRALPVRDDTGQIVRWLGTCTGIDIQVKTAQALQESETRFRQLADAMPQIVYVTAPDGRVEYVNRRWAEFTGQSAADTQGITPLVHPDDLPTMLERWSRAAAAATPFDAEFRLLGRATGEFRWFLTRAVPVRGDDEKVVRWFGTSTDIHDQKRQEIDLRESRRFTESVLHSLPAHLAVIDADGTIVSVNESWRQFGVANGIPPDYEWVGASYFDASRKDDYGERAIDGIRAVARGDRGAFEMEYPCHGNGQERYFVLRANRFRGDGPVRLVITHENVSDRVRAERKLRESASQLRQLTEGMPLFMWACLPSGEYDYLSRQWVEYTGVPMVEQLGFGWLDAVHPDDREPTKSAWQDAVARGGGYDVEFRIRRHDGEYRWFAVRGIPLRDQADRVVRWYGSCTDIDDRKHQEALLERLVTERTAELRQQQIFLDAILDNVSEGIVACDADGRLKLFNAATRRMHGLPAEPLPPDRWADYYHLYEADGTTPMPAERVPLSRAWRGEVVTDAELVIRSDGRPDRYVLCSGEQLRAGDGTPFGAVVSMRDMTEWRKHERQLLLTSTALKASNEELEKFAYIASHDLQEPLRKIQAFGTRLVSKQRGALDDQGKDYLDRILDSAGRMRKLIDDLLAFSRVTTKAAVYAPVDLNTVVRDVLDDLEVRIESSGGRVTVGPLPTVNGDASQLRQMFQNLIGNALKFTRPTVPPDVRVTSVSFDHLPADAPPPSAEHGWRITVADNGIGFQPEYADRIFELFQRLHGRGEYEGTGLGLAIVRKIVLRHGATISVQSAPGVGTTFILDWPKLFVTSVRVPTE